MIRGIVDRKGEQFAYIEGATVYTLEGEPTGYLRQDHIVDLAGNPVWKLVGDSIHTLDMSETIGFISGGRPRDPF